MSIGSISASAQGTPTASAAVLRAKHLASYMASFLDLPSMAAVSQVSKHMKAVSLVSPLAQFSEKTSVTLKELLMCARFCNVSLSHVLNRMERLEKLALENVTPAQLVEILKSDRVSQCTTVQLKKDFSADPELLSACIQKCTSVVNLNLTACAGFNVSTIKTIIMHCPALKRLNVCDNSIGLNRMAIAPDCLRDFLLQSHRFESTALCYNGRNEINKYKQTLIIRGCPIVSDILLETAKSSPDLAVLFLSENSIHGELRAAAPYFVNLKSLNLLHVQNLTVGDVRDFVKYCTKLKYVSLSGRRITNEMLFVIAQSPSVNELRLRDCRAVTRAGLEAVKKANPSLKIIIGV